LGLLRPRLNLSGGLLRQLRGFGGGRLLGSGLLLREGRDGDQGDDGERAAKMKHGILR
jgi:hypothetical protein